MTQLPQVSGTRLARALERAGFRKVHQKGSHALFVHDDDSTRIAVVPLHKGRAIPAGTLRAILKGAQLTIEDLKRCL